jgi:hypothetical protein
VIPKEQYKRLTQQLDDDNCKKPVNLTGVLIHKTFGVDNKLKAKNQEGDLVDASIENRIDQHEVLMTGPIDTITGAVGFSCHLGSPLVGLVNQLHEKYFLKVLRYLASL